VIEDNQDYALSVAQKGIKVLLLNQPWNANFEAHENMKKVNNWEEILRFISNFK